MKGIRREWYYIALILVVLFVVPIFKVLGYELYFVAFIAVVAGLAFTVWLYIHSFRLLRDSVRKLVKAIRDM